MPVQNPKKPVNEADLINLVVDQVTARLPRTWSPRLVAGPRLGPSRPDGILEITAPDGQRASVVIEAKTTLNTRDVPRVETQLRRAMQELPGDTWPLVVARYLSPRTRNALAEQALSYADATGNLRLALDRPAMFLEGLGADSDPWREPDRETNSLRGRPATKVTRALLDFIPPYGVRQLAELAETSLGSTYRAIDFLEREALVTRDDSGAVVDVDWRALIWRWSEDYDFAKVNRTATYFEPRGIERLSEALRASEIEYAVTGSVAAAALAPYTDPRAITVFVDDINAAEETLDLTRAGRASNVVLAVPYDAVGFARTFERGGLVYAAASQVAVDLLAGPGRAPSEAEALMGWMAENQAFWRRRR